jgi:PKD repeat protein
MRGSEPRKKAESVALSLSNRSPAGSAHPQEEVLKPNLMSAKSRGLRTPVALILALVALLSVPVGASAVHWPNFGGDAGRSGNQPVDPPVMPIAFKYRKAEGKIQTSIITTAGGAPTVQRMIYGAIVIGSNNNRNCMVHLQVLATGAPVGPEAGVDVCTNLDDATEDDAFGPRGTDGSVTPVDSSSSSALGQVYAVHNDDDAAATEEEASSGINPQACSSSANDIAIAQIDETDGSLVKDVAVGRPSFVAAIPGGVSGSCGDNTQMSDGYTVESSPMITPANAVGDRDIFFVAKKSGSPGRLFKAHVTDASAKTSTVSFSFVDVPGANTKASPTLAYFRDPLRGGLPSQYVMVAAVNAGTKGISSFRTVDFSAGPTIDENDLTITGTPFTPSVPVTSTGALPGQSGSGADVTPSVYLAYEQTDGKTIVRHFEQVGDNDTLTRVGTAADPTTLDSVPLEGKPSAAMALKQVLVNGQVQANGRLVVSTAGDVFVLNADSLAKVDEYRDNPGETDLTANGFLRTVPLVAGDFIYINQANGFPLVLRLTDAERVCFAADLRPECQGVNEFTEAEGNNTSTFAIGQAALSRNFVQFASDKGAFVYEAVDLTNEPATISIVSPDEGGKLRGNAAESTITVQANDPDGGITNVEFFLDPGCGPDPKPTTETKIGEDSTPENNNQYSITFDTTKCAEGDHTLRVVAHSGNSPDVEATRTVEIDNVANPTASFTVAPDQEEPSGTEFTFDASASAPAATPASQAITKYEWDFDGNGTYDLETTEKVVKHTYGTPAVYDATLRVTQTNGQTETATKEITVTNRPPVASFVASPNPAQAGQTVSFDGSASTDPDGTITKYEWDFDGDTAFDQTTTDPKTTTTYATAGKRTARLRVTDTTGATNIVARDIEVGGPNVPPTASFVITPNPATINTQVSFDGTASRDSDGSVVKYEWDLDGNGAFETNTGANPRAQRAYAVPAVYNVKLRVTDNSGAAVETVRQLTVTGASTTAARKAPKKLTAAAKPKRDRTLPYVFKTSGRLTLPTGVTRADGCTGRIKVTVKVGKKTVSSRTTALRTSCTYSTSVTFRNRARLGVAKSVRISVKFQGNKALTPKSAKTFSARVG